MKKFTRFLAFLLVCSLFCGCVANRKKEAYVPTGDALLMEGEEPEETVDELATQEVTLAYASDRSMTPLIGVNISNRALFSLIYQGLFAADSNSQTYPMLCSHYKVSSDNKVFTVYIETGARFSDGTALTAQDVLATYGDMLADYTNLQQVFAEDNPFTPNYRVTVDNPDNIEAVSAQLTQIDGVASVKAPLAMADTFTSLQTVINYACYGIVAVLAIVSIVVINNTIKITVFNRRKEIGIMKLVGATNGFIRFPFFVEGVTSGLISAGIASGVVCGAYYALCRWYTENPSNLSQMFGGQLVPLEQVWYYIVGGFVVLGFVLCGLGTATSIRKHLNV